MTEQGEMLTVFFEDGPVRVTTFDSPTTFTLQEGISVQEEFFGTPTASAYYRVTASKQVSTLAQVAPTLVLLKRILERLQLLWPFAGGTRVPRPLIDNYEQVRDSLLAREGLHHVSRAATSPIEIGATYTRMPLRGAVALAGCGKTRNLSVA
jgi:hypothetical protein